MPILNTIQKRFKLNKIYTVGNQNEKNKGYHRYCIELNDINYKGETDYVFKVFIDFQDGPRKEEGSIHGVLDTDLLEIVRHRLECFQSGPYSTRENAIALTHIEEALLWLNKRAEERAERNVLGTKDI
jgi:hypothetical protein